MPTPTEKHLNQPAVFPRSLYGAPSGRPLFLFFIIINYYFILIVTQNLMAKSLGGRDFVCVLGKVPHAFSIPVLSPIITCIQTTDKGMKSSVLAWARDLGYNSKFRVSPYVCARV